MSIFCGAWVMKSTKELLQEIKNTEVTSTKDATRLIIDLIAVKYRFLLELKVMIEDTYPNIMTDKKPDGWFAIQSKLDSPRMQDLRDVFIDSLFKEVHAILKTKSETSYFSESYLPTSYFFRSQDTHDLYATKYKEAHEMYEESERITNDSRQLHRNY